MASVNDLILESNLGRGYILQCLLKSFKFIYKLLTGTLMLLVSPETSFQR